MSSQRLLARKIRELKQSKFSEVISRRMQEFEIIGRSPAREVFKELCFCLLTANYTAEGAMRIQKTIDDGFLFFSEKKLAKHLKKFGHRFPNVRAKFIREAQTHKDSIRKIIDGFPNAALAREWLVKNIKGLGYKEASHFLRNIGRKDLSIVDFHIVDVLTRHKMLIRPKTLTKNRYIEIENILRKVSKSTNLTLAELDLYLWFMETGKVLK